MLISLFLRYSQFLQLLTSRDLSRDAISISGYGSNNNANSYSTGGGENYNESIVQRATPWSDAGQVNGSGQISGVQGERAPSEGMFGSLVWSGTGGGSSGRGRRKGGNELLGCLGMGSRRSPRAMTATGGVDHKVHNENGSPRSSARDGTMRAAAQREHFSIAESEQDCIAQAEIGLVGGLRPLRDKYLAGALGRMTGPVLLMFPEMDGYTGNTEVKQTSLFCALFLRHSDRFKLFDFFHINCLKSIFIFINIFSCHFPQLFSKFFPQPLSLRREICRR